MEKKVIYRPVVGEQWKEDFELIEKKTNEKASEKTEKDKLAAKITVFCCTTITILLGYYIKTNNEVMLAEIFKLVRLLTLGTTSWIVGRTIINGISIKSLE